MRCRAVSGAFGHPQRRLRGRMNCTSDKDKAYLPAIGSRIMLPHAGPVIGYAVQGSSSIAAVHHLCRQGLRWPRMRQHLLGRTRAEIDVVRFGTALAGIDCLHGGTAVCSKSIYGFGARRR